jgi:hypothetical protein
MRHARSSPTEPRDMSHVSDIKSGLRASLRELVALQTRSS